MKYERRGLLEMLLVSLYALPGSTRVVCGLAWWGDHRHTLSLRLTYSYYPLAHTQAVQS